MIGAACFVAAAAMLAAEPDFDAFVKEFAGKREGVRSLQARFTELSLLPDERLETQGSLLYAKPRRIIYRTDEPERVTLVDGRYGYEYEPEIKQLMMYDLEEYPQVDAFFLGFDEDIEALAQSYLVEAFTVVEDGRRSRGIKLKPKPEDKDDAFFSEVAIYLRESDFLPFRIYIDNEEDSKTIIEIDESSYVINGALSEEETQLFVAEGTDIILNNEVLRTVGAGGERIPDPIPADGARSAPPEQPRVEETELPPPAASAETP
ncbi:MAG: outer-membrane lipoprotein carrier protein LolA [Candidatus Hydrogenedentes bacterium]|nr:outer-membrane lipoprotein carrier protein LolA [Candidatus Hydrogenedentota bacterium]